MKTVAFYTDPDLAESKVQTLRRAFATNMTWLDNTYPLVMIHTLEDETVPLVYVSGTDSVDLRPDDSVDSYCFFEFYGYSPGDANEMGIYNLGVVFWVDLEKIDTTKTQDYTWNLISHTLKVMEANECYNMSVTTDNIFDRYTFDLDKQQIMRRYSGYKITFDMYGINTFCDYS